MSVAATYVNANQFTVSGDVTLIFVPGRCAKMNCGVDGSKYVLVSKSVYSAPNTTIDLVPVDSDDLTANLISAEVSPLKPHSKKTGNINVMDLWEMRGFRRGMLPSWTAAGTLTINPGFLHINDGNSEKIIINESAFNITISGKTSATWYFIYVITPADNGLLISSSSDISISTTVPAWNDAKGGWYDGATNYRCIGFFLANADGTMKYFFTDGILYYYNLGAIGKITLSVSSAAWSEMVPNVPIGNIIANIQIYTQDLNVPLFYGYIKPKASSNVVAQEGVILTVGSNTNRNAHYNIAILLDADKKCLITTNNATGYNFYYNANSFWLPKGLNNTI